MPGFAVTSSISASEGKAMSAYIKNVGTAPTLLCTAVKKARVTSLEAINTEGGILPFDLILRREVNSTITESYIVKGLRVFKRKHVVLSLVDQDPRVDADKMADLPHTEIVLLPGDSLYAVSKLPDSFDVTVTYSEGIS